MVVAAPAGAAPVKKAADTTVNAPFGCAAPSGTHRIGCLGKARSHRASNGAVSPLTTSVPMGFGPSDIRGAYNLDGTSSGGKTVAVVDAMDDPNAEADLATYRSHYGMPACTTANGCFKKVNQDGAKAPLPAADPGWALEISLDLDMVSATCPDCKITLVEASTPDTAPLMTGVDTAVRMGASAVSNSYGGPEDNTIRAADAHLNHPGVAITASSGDSGYGLLWPASSPNVTSVGGTTLAKAPNARGWSETAWSGAGSGCSASEPKPAWQHDTGCANRTVADVSAVADPTTGVAVYDTFNTCNGSPLCDVLIQLGLAQGSNGYVQVGGTSASSPIIASVYALAGHPVTAGSQPYSHPANLNDVTVGTNGKCNNSYLCTAGPGYDGPTGLGTPNGTGAF